MIKSQDNLNTCNDGHRSSDVLVATIEKLEQTQKKLDMAVSCLELIEVKSDKFNNTCGFIEQLDDIKATCQEALYYIKELNNDKAN